MNVVIDTNVFISALIKDSMTRSLVVNSKHNLLFPEFEFEEINNHKEEILKKSGLSEDELQKLFSYLLKYVKIVKIKEILPYKNQAFDIIGNIDRDDVIFIATALAYNASVWSDDKDFKKQNKVKILTTKDIVENGE